MINVLLLTRLLFCTRLEVHTETDLEMINEMINNVLDEYTEIFLSKLDIHTKNVLESLLPIFENFSEKIQKKLNELENPSKSPSILNPDDIFPGSDTELLILLPILLQRMRCKLCASCLKKSACTFYSFLALKKILEIYTDWNPPKILPENMKINELLFILLDEIKNNLDDDCPSVIAWQSEPKLKHLLSHELLNVLKNKKNDLDKVSIRIKIHDFDSKLKEMDVDSKTMQILIKSGIDIKNILDFLKNRKIVYDESADDEADFKKIINFVKHKSKQKGKNDSVEAKDKSFDSNSFLLLMLMNAKNKKNLAIEKLNLPLLALSGNKKIDPMQLFMMMNMMRESEDIITNPCAYQNVNDRFTGQEISCGQFKQTKRQNFTQGCEKSKNCQKAVQCRSDSFNIVKECSFQLKNDDNLNKSCGFKCAVLEDKPIIKKNLQTVCNKTNYAKLRPQKLSNDSFYGRKYGKTRSN